MTFETWKLDLNVIKTRKYNAKQVINNELKLEK